MISNTPIMLFNWFLIFVFQACAPRYVYYIFMDRMDPVGVCYSARNACSEKRPQIRHHRPCVESGKAMRSETKISCPRCANVYFFLFPHSQILMSVNSLSLSRALYQPPVKPPPNIGMCPEVSLVLAQLQTSWACRIVLHGSEWIQGYSNSFSMSYK